MKIRSDFVTNSSSASYGEVVIDNIVLLEILAKYKALGTFEEFTEFSIGTYKDEDAFHRSFIPDQEFNTLTPAFHLCFDWDSDVEGEVIPHSINEVLEKLLGFMLEFCDSSELTDQFEAEVQQREYEITDAFKLVKWYLRNETYDGRYEYFLFEYDQENGESYKSEGTGNMDF